MNKPKPKFCIGEEVMVVGAINPENNIDRTEIINVYWTKFSHDSNPEWGYQTDHFNKDYWAFSEDQIRKLPPKDRTQWSDCAWQPNKATSK